MDINTTLTTSVTKKSHTYIKVFLSSAKPESRPFQVHRHDSFEIGYFKSGFGVYETSTAKYSIKPGDIFLFRSNELHWVSEISPSEPMLLLNIQFDPRFILSPGNVAFDSSYLRPFINKHHNFCHRLDRNNVTKEKLKTLILDIEDEFNQQQKDYIAMIKLKLMSLFILLNRHFNYTTQDDTFAPSINSFEDIENSISYIHKHLTEDLKLEELAHIANMSPTYYSTLFKKINGISPWEYIIDRRIDLAISQLLNGVNVTVLELALSCGFKNTANFNRSFKKITNHTPSEYKALISTIID